MFCGLTGCSLIKPNNSTNVGLEEDEIALVDDQGLNTGHTDGSVVDPNNDKKDENNAVFNKYALLKAEGFTVVDEHTYRIKIEPTDETFSFATTLFDREEAHR